MEDDLSDSSDDDDYDALQKAGDSDDERQTGQAFRKVRFFYAFKPES